MTATGVDVGASLPTRIWHDRARRAWSALDRVGAVALAGGVAGGFALGAGSRAAMRIVALTSGRIGTGVRPDSGATPGEFTLEGTAFLVMGGGFLGAALAIVITVGLGVWLPRRRRARYVTVAALAAVLPGRVFVDPNNVDFALFGPRWLAVALFTACAVGYGVLLASLERRWATPPRSPFAGPPREEIGRTDASPPTPPATPAAGRIEEFRGPPRRRVARVLRGLIGAGVVVMLTAAVVGDGTGLIAGVAAAIVAANALVRLRPDERVTARVLGVGRTLVVGAAVAGAAWVGAGAVQILAG